MIANGGQLFWIRPPIDHVLVYCGGCGHRRKIAVGSFKKLRKAKLIKHHRTMPVNGRPRAVSIYKIAGPFDTAWKAFRAAQQKRRVL